MSSTVQMADKRYDRIDPTPKPVPQRRQPVEQDFKSSLFGNLDPVDVLKNLLQSSNVKGN